jgi:hypothetical protein
VLVETLQNVTMLLWTLVLETLRVVDTVDSNVNDEIVGAVLE